jgi:hypothetical protein
MFIKIAIVNGSKDSTEINNKRKKSKFFNKALNVKFVNKKYKFCAKINLLVRPMIKLKKEF